MFTRNKTNSVARLLALSICVALTFSLSPLLSTAHLQEPSGSGIQSVTEVLTNENIVQMFKDGIVPEIIIAKIKASPTNFDTSPATLQKLKEAGVTDGVVLAMIESGTKPSAASNNVTNESVELKVVDGTEIEIALTNNVSGQEAHVGDIVDFTVLRPVQIDGVTIFGKGASARGRITTSKKSGRWGKAGKLEWAMQDIQAVDGSRVPARFTKRLVGDSSGGTVAVAAVATAVFLGPVALLWGLKKGKPAIIPAGNKYTAFVHGDSTVKANRDTVVKVQ